jgi:hypothetical protein
VQTNLNADLMQRLRHIVFVGQRDRRRYCCSGTTYSRRNCAAEGRCCENLGLENLIAQLGANRDTAAEPPISTKSDQAREALPLVECPIPGRRRVTRRAQAGAERSACAPLAAVRVIAGKRIARRVPELDPQPQRQIRKHFHLRELCSGRLESNQAVERCAPQVHVLNEIKLIVIVGHVVALGVARAVATVQAQTKLRPHPIRKLRADQCPRLQLDFLSADVVGQPGVLIVKEGGNDPRIPTVYSPIELPLLRRNRRRSQRQHRCRHHSVTHQPHWNLLT